MELLNVRIPSSPQIFSNVSLPAPRFSIAASNKENPVSFSVHTSQFALKRSFCTFLPLSRRRCFRVSALFGRPSTRRNSLSKKLAENVQLRESPVPIDAQTPSRSFDGIEDFQSNSYDDSVKDSLVNSGVGDSAGDPSTVQESKSKLSSVNAWFDKLDNWVNQYKKDVELWGVGTGPIFTVFQDSEGNNERVSINEDEISRRSGASADLADLNFKISQAKSLAKETLIGNYAFPKNSSIVKFIVSGEKPAFLNGIRSVAFRPNLFPKLSRIGVLLLCGSLLFWAAKRVLSVEEDGVEVTGLEKEMLRRKIKARKEREMLEKGSVEVVQESMELASSTRRPQLDKAELMNSISKTKISEDKLALKDSFIYETIKSVELESKIQEIREMARCAREIQAVNPSIVDANEKENHTANDVIPIEIEGIKQTGEKGMEIPINISIRDSKETGGSNGIMKPKLSEDPKSDVIGLFIESVDNVDVRMPSLEILHVMKTTSHDLKDGKTSLCTLDSMKKANQPSNTKNGQLCLSEKSYVRTKPRIIRTVKEAREYLSEKQDKGEHNQELRGTNLHEGGADLRLPSHGELSSSTTAANAYEHSNLDKSGSVSTQMNNLEDAEEGYHVGAVKTSTCEVNDSDTKVGLSVNKENWMEKNFQEFEPMVQKIGTGFRDNYMAAKGRVSEELNGSSDLTQLGSDEDDGELKWMEDDDLRKIVFQVRENELAGRDPFYSMDAQDKLAFFKGLEKKVEKENEKLMKVHEWIHSNIENVDYGADGISLYDPLEKIIPRWKGPPIDKDPQFLNDFMEQRKAFAGHLARISYPMKKDEQNSFQKSEESPSNENVATSPVAYNPELNFHGGISKNSKTIIESSDGSVKAGKKSGKEYWQHTKKWSRGFLEVYNAESDPEVKSIMKDMGKDLDRWITEKEIEEAADLMTKLPKRNKEFIEKRINKLKREMELFGPQAVVSKYREYAEEKEEDYLWWLDLPHILCIELYRIENGEQKIGFYSLEMAADLELNPKQYHVIAFEDPGDCKNFSYIIQAHLEMLGNGLAFVIARPPKDALREAKANGFNVTVIRKGELQLNVDQTLEEVEEQITEIGSKIYHDKIMRERSVDISSLMKGVFGAGQSTRRKRLKRVLKKPTKHERY